MTDGIGLGDAVGDGVGEGVGDAVGGGSVVLAAGWSGLAVTGATTGWDEGRAAGAMAGGFGAGGAEEAPTAAAASRRAPAGT